MSVFGGFLYSHLSWQAASRTIALSRARKAPPEGLGLPASRSRNLSLCDGAHILRAGSRIVCRYQIWEMTMRLIRLAIGVSLVAVSVLGSARAQSPAELSQVSGQEALTNRFESPVSEMDRLSDRLRLNGYFLAGSHDRLR
jgi:hypothetical protein